MLRSTLPLSLVLVLAGCAGDDGTAESGASTTEDASGSGSTAGTAGTDEAGTTPTSTPGEGSTSTPPDTGEDTTSGFSPVAQACRDTCMLLVECEIEDVPNCGIPCSAIEGTVLGCEDEYLAQMACVGALSCEDLQAWSDSTGDHACMAQDTAYDECVAA